MNIMRNNIALLTIIIIIHKFMKHVLLLLIIINEIIWLKKPRNHAIL